MLFTDVESIEKYLVSCKTLKRVGPFVIREFRLIPNKKEYFMNKYFVDDDELL